MSKPKDQPKDAAESANSHALVSQVQTGAEPETDMDDEELVDEDSDDDEEEVSAPGETRAPGLPDETLAERD